MSPKYLWIVLIIATMVCSASCQSGAAREETRPASVWQQFKELSADAITSLRNIAALIISPKLKNRQDICVWKICSRPLKKTNKIPEEKPSESGGRLSDGDMIAILKNLENSRRVNTYLKEIIRQDLINLNKSIGKRQN